MCLNEKVNRVRDCAYSSPGLMGLSCSSSLCPFLGAYIIAVTLQTRLWCVQRVEVRSDQRNFSRQVETLCLLLILDRRPHFVFCTTKICRRTTARRERVSKVLLLVDFLLMISQGPSPLCRISCSPLLQTWLQQRRRPKSSRSSPASGSGW